MDLLKERLTVIKRRLKEDREIYNVNEQMVRNNIINPIIQALGWNHENPEEVKLNDTEEAVDTPDYVLSDHDKNIFVIEVKKLIPSEKEYKKGEGKLIGYCARLTVRWGVLTNGANWKLINNPRKKMPIWDIDIENDNEERVLSALNIITKHDIDKIGLKIKSFKAEKPTIPASTKDGAAVSSNVSISRKFEKIVIDLKVEPGNQVLRKTIEFLMKNGNINQKTIPIYAGERLHKNYLISEKPYHPNGKKFTNLPPLLGKYYVNTNFDIPACENKARYLLKQFGYDPAMLVVKK